MTTKALLLYGARGGGSAEARWWQNAIGGRIEMVPGEGRDILERVCLARCRTSLWGTLQK